MKQRTALLAASCALAGVALVYIAVARAIPPSTPYNAARGEDPEIWQSSSQTQIRELINKHLADPKAMYRLINESYEKKQEGFVANDLLGRLQKDSENTALTIITAYAFVQAAGDSSRAFWQPSTSESNSLVSRRSAIYSLITPEIWEGLDDPALMVMAAVARNEKLKESVDENMQPYKPEATLPAIDLCRRATLLAPKWADAHYWYGRIVLSYFWDFSPEEMERKRDLLITAKSELLKAADLDSGIKSDAYWQLSFVLSELHQSKEALSYLEQSVRMRRPNYALNPKLIEKVRKQFQDEAARQSKQ